MGSPTGRILPAIASSLLRSHVQNFGCAWGHRHCLEFPPSRRALGLRSAMGCCQRDGRYSGARRHAPLPAVIKMATDGHKHSTKRESFRPLLEPFAVDIETHNAHQCRGLTSLAKLFLLRDASRIHGRLSKPGAEITGFRRPRIPSASCTPVGWSVGCRNS